MFLAVTIVGFILMTLGVAMLLVGEAPFLGKRIPALRSRLIGVIFVLFLPLAFGVPQLFNAVLGSDVVQGPVVTWTLFALCVVASMVVLFPVMMSKREPRMASAPAKKNPFGDVDLVEEVEEVVWLEPEPEEQLAPKKGTPEKKPASKKSSKPRVKKSEPFDFS